MPAFKISQIEEVLTEIVKDQMENPGAKDHILPVLRGAPGIGKTSIIRKVAEKLGYYSTTIILAQYDPGDLAGLPYPKDGKAKKLRPGWMPEEDGLVLNVDELGQAFLMNQNLAAQLFEERRLGDHALPAKHAVIAATNRLSDQAGVNAMPSHLKDRIAILDMVADIDDFIVEAANKGLHEHIIAYLRWKPEWLSAFDPKHDACPSPRSWFKASRAYKMDLSFATKIGLMSAVVGEAATTDFHKFMDVVGELPPIEMIWSNPKHHAVPKQAQLQYAIASALGMRATIDTLEATMTFLDRWPAQEMVAFFLQTMRARPEGKALTLHPAVRDWAIRKGAPLLS